MKRDKLFRLFYITGTFFLIVSGCQSCKTDTSNRADRKYPGKYDKTFDLVFKDQINLPLDSLTSPNINCTQYYEDKKTNKPYLCILNPLVNTIYIYDYNNKAIAYKVKLENEGPNGIGGRMEGFYLHTFDSIFVSSRYVVSMVDTGGRKKQSFNLVRKQTNDFTAIPYFSKYQEANIVNDEFYFACAPDKDAFEKSAFLDDQCLIKLNLKTGEFKYKFKPTELFQKGLYGPNFAASYNCFNKEKNLVLLSFQNDPLLFIHSLDANDSAKTVYAGSEHFDEVAPMQKTTRDYEGYTRFYIKNPSYGPVMYDPYRNMYYRFALTPLSDDDYAQRKWWKNKSIIILDSAFNKVGETALSDSCSFLNYFITQEGLFINKAGPYEDSLLYVNYLPQHLKQ